MKCQNLKNHTHLSIPSHNIPHSKHILLILYILHLVWIISMKRNVFIQLSSTRPI